MLFIIHASLALALLSLTAGTALYIWSVSSHGTGSSLGRIVGSIVLFLSALSIVCTFYLGVKIWKEVYLLNSTQISSMEAQKAPNASEENSYSAKSHHHHKK
jgi:hypothetical protein